MEINDYIILFVKLEISLVLILRVAKENAWGLLLINILANLLLIIIIIIILPVGYMYLGVLMHVIIRIIIAVEYL